MYLYCTVCHTRWGEACWNPLEPCPFLDCDGSLTASPPPIKRPSRVVVDQPPLPLLKVAGLL